MTLEAERASSAQDGRALGRARTISLLCAACAIVPGVIWVASALWKMTFAILGRDQGIFQYVGWALLEGERDYVDFREINGPLIHLIHVLFMKLGGADEHRFRVIDVLITSSVFFLVGALLPGISRTKGDASAASLAPTWLERLVWGAAGWVILGSQYVGHDWWQTGQREGFYNLFLMASIALQVFATAPERQPRRAFGCLALAGFLSGATWFGKPTCLAYTAMQAVVLVFNGDERSTRRAQVLAFTSGILAACIVMLASLAAIGDPGRAAHIILTEVPRVYRYIWKLSWVDTYFAWNNAPKLNFAIVTMVVTVVLFRFARPTRRFLAVCILLGGGAVTFLAQGKGFPYHLHPITAGTNLLWLAWLVHLSERLAAPARRDPARHRRLSELGLVGAALVVGFLCFDRAYNSEYARSDWNTAGATFEARQTKEFVARFPWGDYFAWDLREAAAYVRSKTAAGERIQTYGADPYFLFLAQRLSATPYIYSWDLNLDAALRGGSGGKPDENERQWLRDTAATHAREWLAALKARPPVAFVLIDHAPFTYPENADADLEEHCPAVWAWLEEGFVPAARFGKVRVWLRRDHAGSIDPQ